MSLEVLVTHEGVEHMLGSGLPRSAITSGCARRSKRVWPKASRSAAFSRRMPAPGTTWVAIAPTPEGTTVTQAASDPDSDHILRGP